jgi:hypothetical protein
MIPSATIKYISACNKHCLSIPGLLDTWNNLLCTTCDVTAAMHYTDIWLYQNVWCSGATYSNSAHPDPMDSPQPHHTYGFDLCSSSLHSGSCLQWDIHYVYGIITNLMRSEKEMECMHNILMNGQCWETCINPFAFDDLPGSPYKSHFLSSLSCMPELQPHSPMILCLILYPTFPSFPPPHFLNFPLSFSHCIFTYTSMVLSLAPPTTHALVFLFPLAPLLSPEPHPNPHWSTQGSNLSKKFHVRSTSCAQLTHCLMMEPAVSS